MSKQGIFSISIAFLAIFDAIVICLCLSRATSSSPNDNVRSRDGLPYKKHYSAAVGLRASASVHYQLNAPDSDAEWGKLIPSGGHVVYQNNTGVTSKHTVTLYHQLKCLDIIRQQYNKPPSTPISSLTAHCMNYLRQTLLCYLNTGLESVKNVQGSVSRDYDLVCRDWTQLHAEVERNHRAFGVIQS